MYAASHVIFPAFDTARVAAGLPQRRCGRPLATRRDVSALAILRMHVCFPHQHISVMHGVLRPFKCTDGARVRDALHTVLINSGASAYERLIWQLGFTIVEVPAQVPTLPWDHEPT